MYNYSAHLIRVVDGDTVDLTVDLGFSVSISTRFRVFGIDAPEKKAPTLLEGKASQAHLEQLLSDALDGVIHVESTGKDKYGRWVANLTYTSATTGALVNVSERMISEGFAVSMIV